MSSPTTPSGVIAAPMPVGVGAETSIGTSSSTPSDNRQSVPTLFHITPSLPIGVSRRLPDTCCSAASMIDSGTFSRAVGAGISICGLLKLRTKNFLWSVVFEAGRKI